MDTSFMTKLAALTLALMVNSVIIGGIAVVFSDRAQAYTACVGAAASQASKNLV